MQSPSQTHKIRMIYNEKTIKFALPALIAIVVVFALVFGIHRGDKQPLVNESDETVTTSHVSSEDTSTSATTSSEEEDDPADIAQNDEQMNEMQDLLDEDQEDETIAKAKELAASKTDKHRAFALKAFEWYGGLDNLAEIAKLVNDTNADVAESALDSYEHVFRSLQEAPDAKTLNTLGAIIIATHDSARLDSLFGLYKPLDEALALPSLIDILQKANEDDNDELKDLAIETIDFLTEVDSGIDTLEKAQEWLDKHAGENDDN